MGELLHLGALVPATVGACCTLGARRSDRVGSILSALVMLLAMLDAAAGSRLVPVVAWAAILVGLAVALSVRSRSGHGAEADALKGRRLGPGHPVAMTVHGRLGLLVMAALLLSMGETGAEAGFATSVAHHGGAGNSIASLAAGSTAGFAVFSVFVAVWSLRGPGTVRARWAGSVEAICMGLSVVMMTVSAWR